MTENKRFVNNGKDIFQYGEWWCSANGEHCADVIATAINELIEENGQLKNKIKSLTIELSTHKHPLWSTREAERKVNELTELLMNETKKNAVLLEEINSLRTENMRLKKVCEY